MYLFRVVKSNEIINYINGINESTFSIKGENSFNYEDNIKYIHFFKYASHAFYYMNYYNSNNFAYDNFFISIMRVNVPDNILPNVSYGLYNNLETDYDDSLFFKTVPLPEYVIPRNNFKFSFIEEFSNINNGYFSKESFFCCMNNGYLQYWKIEDVYYEYLKRLYCKLNNEYKEVIKYLSSIDLEKELSILSEEIKVNKYISKNDKIKNVKVKKKIL